MVKNPMTCNRWILLVGEIARSTEKTSVSLGGMADGITSVSVALIDLTWMRAAPQSWSNIQRHFLRATRVPALKWLAMESNGKHTT